VSYLNGLTNLHGLSELSNQVSLLKQLKYLCEENHGIFNKPDHRAILCIWAKIMSLKAEIDVYEFY